MKEDHHFGQPSCLARPDLFRKIPLKKTSKPPSLINVGLSKRANILTASPMTGSLESSILKTHNSTLSRSKGFKNLRLQNIEQHSTIKKPRLENMALKSVISKPDSTNKQWSLKSNLKLNMEHRTLNQKLTNRCLNKNEKNIKRKQVDAPHFVEPKKNKIIYQEIAPMPVLDKIEVDADLPQPKQVENEHMKVSSCYDTPGLTLLNLVNQCLVDRVNFTKLKSKKVADIEHVALGIAVSEPELLLQIALYARRALNIRTAANYLIALAATLPETKKYLVKYYKHMVVTPSDWIEIAQLNRNINGTISNSLRVVMRQKFLQFDEYQLQKHNKTKKRSPKLDYIVPDNDEEILELKGPERLTLKNLIRTLHIKDPGNFVMGILGKRYPSTLEEFSQSRLEGTWNPGQANERLKLATAFTWETELSTKGNTWEAWEGLIMSRKLPYMAGLRNLSNIFMARVKQEAEGKILAYLGNRNAVEKSKQMPFQFYNAYKALSDLESKFHDFYDNIQYKKFQQMKNWDLIKKIIKHDYKNQLFHPRNDRDDISLEYYAKVMEKADDAGKHYLAHPFFQLEQKENSRLKREWDELVRTAKTMKHNCKRIYDQKWSRFERVCETVGSRDQIDKKLHQYKKAVSCALAHSLNNLPPVSGTSVFVIKNVNDRIDTACVLAACAVSCCQDALFYVYDVVEKDNIDCINFKALELKKNETILDLVHRWVTESDELSEDNCCKNISTLFELIIMHAEKISEVSNCIYINYEQDFNCEDYGILEQHLNRYRLTRNHKFKTFFIGASRKRKSNQNIIYVDGCNEQVLRYMSESGKENVLHQIQSYASIFNIELDNFANVDPLQAYVPRVRIYKVFISSTFVDLLDYRQLLVDHVIPKVNTKTISLQEPYQFVPVDIRFPEMVETDVDIVEICVRQLRDCHLCINILGDRYGTIPDKYYRGLAPPTGFEFLETFSNISITEAEVLGAIEFKIPIILLAKKNINNSRVNALVAKLNNTSNVVPNLTFGDNDDFVSVAEAAMCMNLELNTKRLLAKCADEVIGRKLLVAKMRCLVYYGQASCVYGAAGVGKSTLFKNLFDEQKLTGHQVVWHTCTTGEGMDSILKNVREQLGIRIQPGLDQANINTSLPKDRKIEIFLDNFEHLETISTWLPNIDDNLAIILCTTVGTKQLNRDNRINNWLEVKGLNISDKGLILEHELGFKPPTHILGQFSRSKDSNSPRFIKLLALGLKRFYWSLKHFTVPNTYDELYQWLFKCVIDKYGAHVGDAISALVHEDESWTSRELWLKSLQYNMAGCKIDINMFEICKIESALCDWAIQRRNSEISLFPGFRVALKNLNVKDANLMISAASAAIVNEHVYNFTEVGARAMQRLAADIFGREKTEISSEYLFDRGFVQRAAKEKILNQMAKKYKNNLPPDLLHKLGILFYRIQKAPHLINSILAQSKTISKDIGGAPSLARGKTAQNIVCRSILASFEVKQIVSMKSSLLLLLSTGIVYAYNTKNQSFSRITLFSTNISLICASKDRLLVCSSFHASILNDNFGVVSNLKLESGPVIACATNHEYFGTIHHTKRAVNLWRSSDGKLMWTRFINGIPSSVSFNLSQSVYHEDCLLVGLWKRQVHVFSLLEGKIIGRIHSTGRASISYVTLIVENRKPFIIIGHGDGSIGWYGARCGTSTAFTKPTYNPVVKIENVKDSILIKSRQRIELWGKQGIHSIKALLFENLIQDLDQNWVYEIFLKNNCFVVFYKHGFIAVFDQNWTEIARHRLTCDGFHYVTPVATKFNEFLVEAQTVSSKTFEICVSFWDDGNVNLTAKEAAQRKIDNTEGDSLLIERSRDGNYSIDVVGSKSKPLKNVVKYHIAKENEFMFIITTNALRRIVKKNFVSRTPVASALDRTIYHNAITGAYFQSSHSNYFLAISCEYNNVRIFDNALTETRLVTCQSGERITHVTLIKDLLVTCHEETVNIWSKKKSEVVATLQMKVTTSPIIELWEVSGWDEEMVRESRVDLNDIYTVTVGTQSGCVVWYPTQKKHLATATPGKINDITCLDDDIICAIDDAVWNMKIKSNTKPCHPSKVLDVKVFGKYIFSVCRQFVFISNRSGMHLTKLCLNQLTPIGFVASGSTISIACLHQHKLHRQEIIEQNGTWQFDGLAEVKEMTNVRIAGIIRIVWNDDFSHMFCITSAIGASSIFNISRIEFVGANLVLSVNAAQTNELETITTTCKALHCQYTILGDKQGCITFIGPRDFSQKFEICDEPVVSLVTDNRNLIVATAFKLAAYRINVSPSGIQLSTLTIAIVETEISCISPFYFDDDHNTCLAIGHEDGSITVYRAFDF